MLLCCFFGNCLLQQHTYLFQLFFSLLVMLFQADSCPVDLGCLEALGGHSGITEAYKNGIVGPSSAIQTNNILLVRGQLAINRKVEKY